MLARPQKPLFSTRDQGMRLLTFLPRRRICAARTFGAQSLQRHRSRSNRSNMHCSGQQPAPTRFPHGPAHGMRVPGRCRWHRVHNFLFLLPMASSLEQLDNSCDVRVNVTHVLLAWPGTSLKVIRDNIATLCTALGKNHMQFPVCYLVCKCASLVFSFRVWFPYTITRLKVTIVFG